MTRERVRERKTRICKGIKSGLHVHVQLIIIHLGGGGFASPARIGILQVTC